MRPPSRFGSDGLENCEETNGPQKKGQPMFMQVAVSIAYLRLIYL
jgi:hypothetical protein